MAEVIDDETKGNGQRNVFGQEKAGLLAKQLVGKMDLKENKIGITNVGKFTLLNYKKSRLFSNSKIYKS